jgi:hypothetical protein
MTLPLSVNIRTKPLLHVLAFLIGTMLLLRACSNQPRFDFRTGARMPVLINVVDTTHLPVINKYRLEGSDTLFNMLIFTLQNPRDITPNQLDGLLKWISSSTKPVDTAHKK